MNMAYCDSTSIYTFREDFFKSSLLECVCQVPTFHSVEVGRNFFPFRTVHIFAGADLQIKMTHVQK
jgi:hypothetical protein